MQLQRILVTVDLSRYDQPALEMASSLARDSGARLLIVHVRESPAAYGGDVYRGELNPSEEKLRQMLTAIVPREPGIAYDHHLIQGDGTAALEDSDVARAIVRFADEHEVDLIVASSHGRTGLKRIFLGSVVEKIVRRSMCPVLTLKLHRPPA